MRPIMSRYGIVNFIDFQLDLNKMYEALGHDEDIVLNYSKLFIKTSKERLLLIEEGFKTQNQEELKKLVHTLKGAVANFYIEELSHEIKNLENNIGQMPLDRIHQDFKQLKKKLVPLVDYLDNFVNGLE